LGGKRRMGYIDSEVIIMTYPNKRTYYAIQNEPVHHAINFFLCTVPTKVTYKNNSDLHSTGFDPIKEM
jgi:hypothetical protein